MIVLDRDHLGLVDVRVRRNAFGRQVASFETDLERRRAGRAAARRLHPRAVDRGGRAGRRGAGRGRRPSGARARGALPRRRVPSGADRRHAAPRAVSGSRRGGASCPGIASGRRSSTRRAPPTRSAGKLFSKLTRAIIVAAKEGGGDPANNLALAERDREGEVVLDAEGQHRARDREGLGRGRRRDALRDDRLRGLRPRGRRGDRRGADRQQEPHRRRRAPRVREARRHARRDRRGRVAVRAARRRGRPGRGRRRGRALPGRRRRGRRGRRAGRRRLPGHERARRASPPCATRSRRPASRSTRPSCR